ncbi:Ras-related protein RabJ [Cyphomyrmex costatus]|uniref:Ras-related protein RabJ n=1 Tax=Cyphomyrmex costatus TaxID=456900 RepID=A0A195CVP9_9HYME|nr:Ras-related protein RabJ [Cyphomyrmex costatus]
MPDQRYDVSAKTVWNRNSPGSERERERERGWTGGEGGKKHSPGWDRKRAPESRGLSRGFLVYDSTLLQPSSFGEIPSSCRRARADDATYPVLSISNLYQLKEEEKEEAVQAIAYRWEMATASENGVWDTAGQERFRSMAPMYYRTSNAALLVFDLTQYNTFTAIKGWVKELQQNVEETMVLVLIGNKSDLVQQRQVDGEECRRYATTIGATYHEISALYNEGVENVFLMIALRLRRMVLENNDMNTTLKISDSNTFLKNDDILPSPSIEESPQNTSIAHGIHERPFTCC